MLQTNTDDWLMLNINGQRITKNRWRTTGHRWKRESKGEIRKLHSSPRYLNLISISGLAINWVLIKVSILELAKIGREEKLEEAEKVIFLMKIESKLKEIYQQN